MDWAAPACVFLQIPSIFPFLHLKSYTVQNVHPASPITHPQEITLGQKSSGSLSCRAGSFACHPWWLKTCVGQGLADPPWGMLPFQQLQRALPLVWGRGLPRCSGAGLCRTLPTSLHTTRGKIQRPLGFCSAVIQCHTQPGPAETCPQQPWRGIDARAERGSMPLAQALLPRLGCKRWK